MLKRLWQILGPVVCAVLIVLLVFICVPTANQKHDLKAEKKDAVSLSKMSFKSKYKKVRALTDAKHRFVPFLVLANGCALIKCIRLSWQKNIIATIHLIYSDNVARLR